MNMLMNDLKLANDTIDKLRGRIKSLEAITWNQASLIRDLQQETEDLRVRIHNSEGRVTRLDKGNDDVQEDILQVPDGTNNVDTSHMCDQTMDILKAGEKDMDTSHLLQLDTRGKEIGRMTTDTVHTASSSEAATNSIIFHGLAQAQNEDEKELRFLLFDFLRHGLNITPSDLDRINIAWAYRLELEDDEPRPIRAAINSEGIAIIQQHKTTFKAIPVDCEIIVKPELTKADHMPPISSIPRCAVVNDDVEDHTDNIGTDDDDDKSIMLDDLFDEDAPSGGVESPSTDLSKTDSLVPSLNDTRHAAQNHNVVNNNNAHSATDEELGRTVTSHGDLSGPRDRKKDKDRVSKTETRKASQTSQLLWRFLLNALCTPSLNPYVIEWKDKQRGVFKINNTKVISKIWGDRINSYCSRKKPMNYEKFSRAIRYYYSKKIVLCNGDRLTYQFGPNATGWESAAMTTTENMT